jgi:hypothetical protein
MDGGSSRHNPADSADAEGDAVTVPASLPLMQPLDVVAFWGATSDPIRHPKEVISGIIRGVTKGPSHIVAVRQSNGDIIESTKSDRYSGVQTNPLKVSMATYQPGSQAQLYRLTPESRARSGFAGLEAFYKLCGESDGFIHYGVDELFRFLLLPDWIDDKLHPSGGMVCSVWVASCLETAHVTIGVDPRNMTPGDLVALSDPKRIGGPVFQPGVRIM